jgi:hypothetical protein
MSKAVKLLTYFTLLTITSVGKQCTYYRLSNLPELQHPEELVLVFGS